MRAGHIKFWVPKLIPAFKIKLPLIWKARYSNFCHLPCTRSSLACPFHPSADPWPPCKQPDAALSHLSLCGTGCRAWNFCSVSFSLTLFASSLSRHFHFYIFTSPFFCLLPPNSSVCLFFPFLPSLPPRCTHPLSTISHPVRESVN